MDLRQLRYFVAIVEQGSFSRAALVLRVAQPALSLHVRNMEADFGTALLIRSPQGVRTTEAGGILLRDAKSIIRQFEETRQEIRGRDIDPQGSVCIGLTSTISAALGAPLLMELKREHPRIKLRIAEAMSGTIMNWLRDGQADIGVLFRPVEEPGFATCAGLKEELVLVSAMTPPDGCDFLNDDVVAMNRLSALPMILPSPGHGMRQMVDARVAKAHCSLNVIMDIDSHVCARRLVEQRVAYSIMPTSAVEAVRHEGRLRRWRIEPSFTRSIYVVHPNDRPLSGAASAVVDLCNSMLATIVAESAVDRPAEVRFPTAPVVVQARGMAASGSRAF